MEIKTKEELELMPISEFKANVKCCYNCDMWCTELNREVLYAPCMYLIPDADTAWDSCCDGYRGNAEIENTYKHED